MKDIIHAVETFNNNILGLPIPVRPQMLAGDRLQWAITAFEEEAQELCEANTVEDQADAVADLVYFALGRLQEMGVDAYPLFAEIQRANMAKVKGEKSTRPGSLGFDAIKPDGWVPPANVVHSIFDRRPPSLLVIGHARHGKDTVCEILAKAFGYRFTSSSMFCAEKIVYPYLHDAYESAAACFWDRSNHRQLWADLIANYVRDDGGRIAREILQSNDIYCGIRHRHEFEQSRTMFDYVVWVDGRMRLPPEITMELTPLDADIIIDNNGEAAALFDKVTKVANLILGR